MDLALASCRNLPEPDPDAEPLSAALARAGIDARVLAWDDPSAEFSRAAMTVLRSTWNYPFRPQAFAEWLDGVARVSALWNPLRVARWNLHKAYLLELERRGLPVVPTELIRRGSNVALRDILAGRGWRDVVIKPAISAASLRTMRVDNRAIDGGTAHLRSLVAERDALVQPYLDSVTSRGERALVWIDGALTHAVRKTPRFAGQDETVSKTSVPIDKSEAAVARRAVAAVGNELLYARVDLATGADGTPRVMELELIEPSLFFAQHPPALERFVRGIARRLREVTSRIGENR